MSRCSTTSASAAAASRHLPKGGCCSGFPAWRATSYFMFSTHGGAAPLGGGSSASSTRRNLMESSLYQLRELSDVFVDACVRDASGSLLFLSCYGRDTALTQLFAAFSLSPAEGGFRAFSLTGADDRDHYVSVSGAERPEEFADRVSQLVKCGQFCVEAVREVCHV